MKAKFSKRLWVVAFQLWGIDDAGNRLPITRADAIEISDTQVGVLKKGELFVVRSVTDSVGAALIGRMREFAKTGRALRQIRIEKEIA